MGTMGGLFQLRKGGFRKLFGVLKKNFETKKKLKKLLDIEKVFVLNGRLFHFKKGACLRGGLLNGERGESSLKFTKYDCANQPKIFLATTLKKVQRIVMEKTSLKNRR